MAEAVDLTLPGDGANLRIFGAPTCLLSDFLAIKNRAVYLWGRAAHRAVSHDALLEWCSDTIDSQHLQPLRELYGNFVLIIDDRNRGEVSFVSDIMGIRPWFVGAYRGKLVAGSNVLSICAAGLSEGNVNYDEVSAWLRYNQPCQSASVVSDYACMNPGEVLTCRRDGTIVQRRTYGQLDYGMKEAAAEDVVEECYHAAADSVRMMTRDLGEVNLPLSGGYDSRLVFAVASQLPWLNIHLSTLQTREYEVDLARQVAAAFDHPLNVIHGRKRILDLFDDPFCLTPGGFITGRNLTSNIARKHPGMPLLSGFMGDGVMRGSLLAAGNAHFAKDTQNLSIDELTATIDKRYTMHGHRLNLLSDRIRRRIAERASNGIRTIVSLGIETGRPTIYADLHCRHRFYFANIILQHLGVAEGITPYVNFRSLNARVKYRHDCFNSESYPKLFAKFFPQISRIPHSHQAQKQLQRPTKPKTPPTRHLRRWSADLAAGLLLTPWLAGAKKKTIFSLLPSGLLGETVYQDEIAFLYKLMMFERTLSKHHIHFDWNGI